ncbi:zinc ribbon domain-containing protein [Micromonospora avicenniae]|uniref:zinc ribbon domain-containing protein n=1 Tax=Micromonospora avicenniae TaxID=1198245 RepID=UPI00331F0AD1
MCGTCGGRVGIRYSRADRKVTYKCVEPTARCRTITADTIDDAVASLLLKTMTPQQIQVALAAAGEVTDRQVRANRAAELAVERARYEAERAERAFMQVESENRLVARTLETRWETKLAAMAESEAALATARAVKAPVPDHDALRALATDLPRLWDAPTTSPRDRQTPAAHAHRRRDPAPRTGF